MNLNNFLSLTDLSSNDIETITNTAIELKAEHKAGIKRNTLDNKSFAMIFEKPSTRTFVSFSVAITQLGGQPVNINQSSLGGRETLHDVAKTLSRYVDGIIIRTFAHETVTELSEHASVPIINALTDKYHPCQAMADYLTIKEHIKKDKIKVTYLGDGFNVANSLLLLAAKTDMEIAIACPKGFEPDADVIASAQEVATSKITITNDPIEAAKNADVLYTDTWTSMGMEKEAEERIKIFSDFQVNSTLMANANSDAIVMHCLPAHRGQEITNDVIDSKQSVVFDQAENRLWAQKAVLELMYK